LLLHEPRPIVRANAPPAPVEPGMRVLLVDDNVDFTEVLGPLLRGVGYDVTIAHDGPAALSLLRQPFPHIAIIDIGLPVMDGYELGIRLRHQVGAEMRLFAMTGYGQPDDQEKSRRLGFERHLVKPVEPMSLLAALAEPMPTAKAM
jgi:CheY-like chemotaxis protein